jgi:kynurenine formamidase
MAVETAPPGEDEVIVSYFGSLSNWGRWGSDDQLGTMNFVTPAVRSAALKLASAGTTVSCAWDMVDLDGQTRIHDVADEIVGPGQQPRSQFSGEEYAIFQFHGRGTTHLDALSHAFWEGKAYGGVPVGSLDPVLGATQHAMTNLPDGIVTRGVLLDLPAVFGDVPRDARIPPDMLDEAERELGVSVRSGDALLIRTGFGRLRGKSVEPEASGSRPGLAPGCLPWLHGREVAVLGSDATNDPEPFRRSTIPCYVHTIGIVAMGLWLLDNANLEALSAVCRGAGRYEFLLVIAPLRLAGATGSPVNPLAIL